MVTWLHMIEKFYDKYESKIIKMVGDQNSFSKYGEDLGETAKNIKNDIIKLMSEES